MSKKHRKTKQTASTQSPNWVLWGGLGGLFVVAILGLVIYSALQPSVAAEPTPVLNETVASLDGYCEANPERCVVVGAADAPVSFVEVSDHGCSHCYNFNRDTAGSLQEEYVTPGEMRWVLLPYANSDQVAFSAESVLCAAEQSPEIGFRYHHELFNLQPTRDFNTADGFSTIASAIDGLDIDSFDQCVADGRYRDTVSLNRQAARQVGVEGTPTFFINGSPISGNREIELFRNTINSKNG